MTRSSRGDFIDLGHSVTTVTDWLDMRKVKRS
jgi:hypothetical protein